MKRSSTKLVTARDLERMFDAVSASVRKWRETGVLLVGGPGAGKVMVARRLATLVPTPKGDDALALDYIYLRAGLREHGPWTRAPFRAPHHTVSVLGMLGGGTKARTRPGEVSLAHSGTLLLDEVVEFSRSVLAATLHALDDQRVVLPGVGAGGAEFPSSPRLLVLTTLPCPCGYALGGGRKCTCSPRAIERHVARLEPLMGHIDERYHLALDESARERLVAMEP